MHNVVAHSFFFFWAVARHATISAWRFSTFTNICHLKYLTAISRPESSKYGDTFNAQHSNRIQEVQLFSSQHYSIAESFKINFRKCLIITKRWLTKQTDLCVSIFRHLKICDFYYFNIVNLLGLVKNVYYIYIWGKNLRPQSRFSFSY